MESWVSGVEDRFEIVCLQTDNIKMAWKVESWAVNLTYII